VHHIIWDYLQIVFGALKRCVAMELRYNKDNKLNIFEDGAVERLKIPVVTYMDRLPDLRLMGVSWADGVHDLTMMMVV
jgi:hypothetical protein